MKSGHCIYIEDDLWKEGLSRGFNMSRLFKEHLIEALDIQEENNKDKTPRHEKKIKTMIKHRNGKTVITAIALSTISKETGTPMSTLHNYCKKNNIEVIQS